MPSAAAAIWAGDLAPPAAGEADLPGLYAVAGAAAGGAIDGAGGAAGIAQGVCFHVFVHHVTSYGGARRATARAGMVLRV